MKCEIRYFGMIAERVGMYSEWIDLAELINGKRISEWLTDRYPQLNGMTYRTAVDNKMSDVAGEAAKVIAVLPPFAGG